jgi:hypothetical protein
MESARFFIETIERMPEYKSLMLENPRSVSAIKSEVFGIAVPAFEGLSAINEAVSTAKGRIARETPVRKRASWKDDPNRDLIFHLLFPQTLPPRDKPSPLTLDESAEIERGTLPASGRFGFDFVSSLHAVGPGPAPGYPADRIESWVLSQPVQMFYRTPPDSASIYSAEESGSSLYKNHKQNTINKALNIF